MEKMKTTVFGGYNRAEVDAKFWDLQKRAEKAEADFAQATADCETLQQTAADLRRELFAQEERNAKLQSDLETAQANTGDSGIIGKVYLHAYETGAEIAGTARDSANGLLTQVDAVFTDNKAELDTAAQELSAVGQEIAELIGQMNEQILRLQDILSSFNQKVADIPTAYDGVAAVQTKTDEQINAAVSEYETSAQSFLELIRSQEQPQPVEEKEESPIVGNFRIIEPVDEPVEESVEEPVAEEPTETPDEPEIMEADLTRPDEPEKAEETPAEESVAETQPAPQETPRPALNVIKAENEYPVPPAVAQARAIVEQAAAIFEKNDLPKSPEDPTQNA